MDPRLNPFAPGAGMPPPELAGRDDLIERTAIGLDRIRAGHPARGVVLEGMRGVGKTVLLHRIRLDAEARGIATVWLDAGEGGSLPARLAPALGATMLRLERGGGQSTAARRALQATSEFIRAVQHELVLDGGPRRIGVENGDLASELTDLLVAVARCGSELGTAMVLFVDELQAFARDQTAALMSALHAAAADRLPVTMVAAGLPNALGQIVRNSSRIEQLFEVAPLDRLKADAAARALLLPAAEAAVEFDASAIVEILRQSQGYPYFLQEWGKQSWNAAERSPIRKRDAVRASAAALAELDAGFFRRRFDRLTAAEKRYLRAMAELGGGPHRSGDIAAVLERKVTAVAPLRNALITKGLVFSPAYGDTQFAAPHFDEFLRRLPHA